MKDYTGTVLNFDQRSFDESIRAYTKILSVIDQAGEAYEALDTTFEFNQEVFKDMLSNKSENIHAKYAAVIDAQINALKITSKAVTDSMKSQIKIDVQALEDKIEAIFTALNNVYQYQSPSATIYFDVSNIPIVDGKATITEETKATIKDKCETKIRTEDQSTLYNLALQLQADYKKVMDFIREKNPKIIQSPYPRTIFHDNGGRLTETREGELKINPSLLYGI